MDAAVSPLPKSENANAASASAEPAGGHAAPTPATASAATPALCASDDAESATYAIQAESTAAPARAAVPPSQG